jgi:hypothetical protein
MMIFYSIHTTPEQYADPQVTEHRYESDAELETIIRDCMPALGAVAIGGTDKDVLVELWHLRWGVKGTWLGDGSDRYLELRRDPSIRLFET